MLRLCPNDTLPKIVILRNLQIPSGDIVSMMPLGEKGHSRFRPRIHTDEGGGKMPYEILKGARPPRWMIRMHYVKTREMVEARIPAIANLPKIEPQVPGVPSGMPTVPSVIWSRIIYPYDVFQKVRGMVSGELSESSTESSSMPDRKVKTV